MPCRQFPVLQGETAVALPHCSSASACEEWRGVPSRAGISNLLMRAPLLFRGLRGRLRGGMGLCAGVARRRKARLGRLFAPARRSLVFLVLPAMGLVAAGAQAAPEAGPEPAAVSRYSFGVVPEQSASALAGRWGPLLGHLGKRCGMVLQFETAPDIPEFERRVAAGRYDFAFMNPYHYTQFSQDPGYRAISRARDERIHGVIVVRRDSPYLRISDLAGATLAFASPNAFGAAQLPLRYLREAGVGAEAAFVGSHESVYRLVARGFFPGGGGIVRTLEAVDHTVRRELRVLWTSRGYTPHAVAAHPRVSPGASERLVEAMTALADDDGAGHLLGALGVSGFVRARDAHWDDVRGVVERLPADLGDVAQ